MDGVRRRRASTPSRSSSTRSLETSGQLDFHIDIKNILLEISDDITDEQMRRMLFRLKDVIPDRIRESIKEPYQIFEFLEDRGHISNTSLDYLIHLFTDLQYHKLAKKLKRYNLHNSKKQKAHKCIMIGKSSSGKSALCLRIKHGVFRENYYTATLDPDCFSMHIFIEGDAVPINLWDTAGMEMYSLRLPAQFFHGAVVVLLVFDITCSESFNNTLFCRNQIRLLCDDDVTIFLVGNKSDLQERRVISVETAQARALEFGATYLEVSAQREETTEHILHEIGKALQQRNILLDTSVDDNISFDASTQTNNNDDNHNNNRDGRRRFSWCKC